MEYEVEINRIIPARTSAIVLAKMIVVVVRSSVKETEGSVQHTGPDITLLG
jgi:hypothetical protein